MSTHINEPYRGDVTPRDTPRPASRPDSVISSDVSLEARDSDDEPQPRGVVDSARTLVSFTGDLPSASGLWMYPGRYAHGPQSSHQRYWERPGNPHLQQDTRWQHQKPRVESELTPPASAMTITRDRVGGMAVGEKSYPDIGIDATDREEEYPATLEYYPANANESRATMDWQSTVVIPPTALQSTTHVVAVAEWQRTAWWALLGAWFSCFATLGPALSFGVFQAYYALEVVPDRSAFEVAWIGSLQLALPIFVVPGVALVLERGRFHQLMIGGSAFYVCCLVLISISSRFYQLLLTQGVGCGLSAGLVLSPPLKVVQYHFGARAPLAVAVALSGASAGGIVFTCMLNSLLRTHADRLEFANSVRVAALLASLTLIVSNATIRPGALRVSLAQARLDVSRFASKKSLKNPEFLLDTASLAFLSLGLYFPIFFLQLGAERLKVDSKLSFAILAIFHGSGTVGRPLFAWASTRLGARHLLAGALVPCVLVTVGFLGVERRPVAALASLAAIFGLFSASIPMPFSNEQHRPMRSIFQSAVAGVCTLVSGPISGVLLGEKLVWWRPITLSALTLTAGALLAVLAQRFSFTSEDSPANTTDVPNQNAAEADIKTCQDLVLSRENTFQSSRPGVPRSPELRFSMIALQPPESA